jgi:hypothetical protein
MATTDKNQPESLHANKILPDRIPGRGKINGLVLLPSFSI